MKQLISIKDLNMHRGRVADKAAPPLVVSSSGKMSLYELSTGKKHLEEQIGSIDEGKVISFVSRAHWNQHEMVQHLALQLEKPNLYFTTWAMKEQPARALVDMKSRGILNKIFCLISDRMPGNDRQALQLLQPFIAGHKEMKLHAKVAVLLTERRGCVLIGSSNWSANPRIEAGVILCDTAVATDYANWILHEIKS